MRALRFHSYGPPDVLRIGPAGPSPARGSRCRACGLLTPLDSKIRRPCACSALPAPPARSGHRFRRDVARRTPSARRVGEACSAALPFGRDGALPTNRSADDGVLPIRRTSTPRKRIVCQSGGHRCRRPESRTSFRTRGASSRGGRRGSTSPADRQVLRASSHGLQRERLRSRASSARMSSGTRARGLTRRNIVDLNSTPRAHRAARPRR